MVKYTHKKMPDSIKFLAMRRGKYREYYAFLDNLITGGDDVMVECSDEKEVDRHIAVTHKYGEKRGVQFRTRKNPGDPLVFWVMLKDE